MPSPLPDLSGFTVLVVEDDPDGLHILATALTACGAQVLTATNTTLARRHLATVMVDLIITDLGLPGESGAAFISWLRIQPGDTRGAAAVIAITGDPQEFPAIRLGGFAAYFQKPLDVNNVCATAGALLRPLGPSVEGSLSGPAE